MKGYDTEAIRELLTIAFGSEEFTQFCYDHFREVSNDFDSGQPRGVKIQFLIDYCARYEQFEELLRLVKEKNPCQFARFSSQAYRTHLPTSESETEFYHLKRENSTKREIREYEREYLHSLEGWVHYLWDKERLSENRISSVLARDKSAGGNGHRSSEDHLLTRQFRKPGRPPASATDVPEIREQLGTGVSKGQLVSLEQILKDVVGRRLGRSEGRYALLGEPGSGKTTALRKIALESARFAEEARQCRPIPILVDLRWYRQKDGTGEPISFDQFLRDYLAGRYDKEVPPQAAFVAANLDHYLHEGSLLILLDSVNEMPREDLSKRLDKIQLFLSRHACRAVVACRGRHWDKQNILKREVELLPLDKELILEFITMQVADREIAQDFFASLDKEWLRLSCNPQRLQVLIDVCYDRERERFCEPPNTVAELFNVFARRLVSKEMDRPGESRRYLSFSADDVVLALGRLGYEMTQDVGEGTLVDWERALNCLGSPLASSILDFACEVRILCRPSTVWRGSEQDQPRHAEVRFTHQMLQEYFASRELNRRLSVEDLSPLLRELYWEETILLLADTVENPDQLIREIWQAQSPPTSYTLRLAAECISRRKPDFSSEIIEIVRNGLGHLLEHGRLGIKASAIIALGYLNDEESVNLVWDQVGNIRWITNVALATLYDMYKMGNPSAWERLSEYYTKSEFFALTLWRLAKDSATKSKRRDILWNILGASTKKNRSRFVGTLLFSLLLGVVYRGFRFVWLLVITPCCSDADANSYPNSNTNTHYIYRRRDLCRASLAGMFYRDNRTANCWGSTAGSVS